MSGIADWFDELEGREIPIKVVSQTRQMTKPMVVAQFLVPAGVEQELTGGNEATSDVLLLQAQGSSQSVEFYAARGTAWGSGVSLLAPLSLTGYIGPLFVRVDPAATASADIRLMMTRALSQVIEERVSLLNPNRPVPVHQG